DGSHCGYADSGSLCDFGEFGFSGLSREEQQSITHALLLAYFDYYLRDNAAGLGVIQNYDGPQSNTETQIECLSSVAHVEAQGILLFPNPCTEVLFLQGVSNGSKNYCGMDLTGRVVASGSLNFSGGRAEVSTVQLPAGVYTVVLDNGRGMRFVKR
ncbi:MAG: T9SS type A sorting domain-containing protein, partial [Flavobacteriales bacterium]